MATIAEMHYAFPRHLAKLQRRDRKTPGTINFDCRIEFHHI
jgi:hypothetical protein